MTCCPTVEGKPLPTQAWDEVLTTRGAIIIEEVGASLGVSLRGFKKSRGVGGGAAPAAANMTIGCHAAVVKF